MAMLSQFLFPLMFIHLALFALSAARHLLPPSTPASSLRASSPNVGAPDETGAMNRAPTLYGMPSRDVTVDG